MNHPRAVVVFAMLLALKAQAAQAQGKPLWRSVDVARQLETGFASTIQDIAAAEKVSDRFVSRMIRLAYLSPEVLDHLVMRRVPPVLSLNDLVAVADRPWAEQMHPVFS